MPGESAGLLQMMDAATTNSVMCFQLEPLGPSPICQSCVRTSLFAPAALKTHPTHAAKHLRTTVSASDRKAETDAGRISMIYQPIAVHCMMLFLKNSMQLLTHQPVTDDVILTNRLQTAALLLSA